MNGTGTSKVVLVTGASSGLGRAIARRLVKAGHRVYGTSRRPEAQADEGFVLLRMDLLDDATVNAAVAQVLQNEGRIDVVVNNAGRGIQGALEDLTPEQAMAIYDLNLVGLHRVCRAVLPGMRERRRGLIINISSIASNFGLPYRGLYSVTKAGVDRYTEALRIELAPFQVRVVSMQPGEFATNVDSARIKPEKVSDAYRARYERAMELLGSSLHYSRDPNEFAEVVAKVIAKERPRPLYRVAKGVQRLSVLLKFLLPGRLFEGLLAKHYE